MARERLQISENTPPEDLGGQVVRLGSRPYLLLSFSRQPTSSEGNLTLAERQVAVAVLQGLSNAEIGNLRGSSPRTVANQIANIYRKLGIGSRSELAARWGRALSPAME
ncbi:MAG TPA: helix-turn-helix transcriptional regulator [bacterium]|nr:helix-turn-helix transcriptional regulator [bacterium]